MPSDKIYYGYSELNFPEYNVTDNWDYPYHEQTKTIPRELWNKWFSYYRMMKSCAVGCEVPNGIVNMVWNNGIHLALNKPIHPVYLKAHQTCKHKIHTESLQLGDDVLNLALVVHGD